ncbi:MAG: class I SAM-dependent methyltransferase [Bryobacteraceae bacterium]
MNPVLDLIEAFRRSKTMFTAVRLGVFDRLPADLSTLVRETGSDAGALERLLDGCVGLGLAAKREGRYENTEVARIYLRRSSPRTLAGYILYSDQVLYPMWARLEDAVRDGSHRWGQGEIFDHFFRSDESMRTFLAGMHGLGMLSSPLVVAAFDLRRFRRLVDLGGATGHLAAAARERYPAMQVAVFDLPQVIAAAPAGEGVEWIAGDFFQDPLPPADLYALGRILHDWSEEKIRVLLRKIHAALPPGGALLIAEKLLDPDKSGPVEAHMQSLNMLVCTEGKERTLEEYRELLVEAGFARVEGRRTGAPLDAVMAELTGPGAG